MLARVVMMPISTKNKDAATSNATSPANDAMERFGKQTHERSFVEVNGGTTIFVPPERCAAMMQ